MDSSAEALNRLRQRTEASAAIALVNLLKFAPAVEGDGGLISGAEAYAQYVACVEPAVLREGGRPVFRARGSTVLLGSADQNGMRLSSSGIRPDGRSKRSSSLRSTEPALVNVRRPCTTHS